MSNSSAEVESRRLAALKRYEILDTPADGAFDRITSIAARILDVPIAIVSLVDEDRIWFKSAHGLDVQQIGRDPGLCASAILSDEVYVVRDAIHDVRTLANPLVAGELGLRYYVAAPLKTADGFRVGTLCIIDRTPREPSKETEALLADLAAVVVDEMELRLAARRLAQREQQLRETSKLEALGRLSSAIAHDFNNELQIILTEANVPPAMIDLDTQQRLGRLRDSVWRARAVVGQLAAFSRNQPLLRETLSLSELVDDVTRMYARLSAPTITLTTEIATPVDGVMADRSLLTQVFMNLVRNACDAMPDGGRVTLSVSVLDVGDGEMQGAIPHARAGQFARVLVRDDGHGMSAETRERAFEPFFTTKPPAHGTGLGLSSALGIVVQHNGWMTLQSEPGRGTVLGVYLPIEEGGAQKTAPGALRLLLIEDEPMIRATLAAALRRKYVVVVAGDCETASACFARGPAFDIVVSDIRLPDGDGVELVTKLRGTAPDLPVVFISGQIGRADVLPDDVTSFLAKPFDLDELRWVIDKHVARRQRRPQP